MKANREIRASKVRVITENGEQVGIFTLDTALAKAREANLDLVEVSPKADPPVCKIIDYGKLRYQQTKKDREQKKTKHQIKVKEVKLKPNIDRHDVEFKLKRAREFLGKGQKVRVTCMFRGREMMYPENGRKVINQFCLELDDISAIEAPPKMMGRSLTLVLAPAMKKKKGEKSFDKDEDKKSDEGEI